jgi:predicted permease
MDLRYALRGLLKAPGFAVVAVITLTLGIGANTAIFSVVYSVLLAPFPYDQPERLVQIWGTKAERGWFRNSLSAPNFWDFKERNQSFEYLAAYGGSSVNLTGDDYAERIRAGRLSAEFFRALGVTPTIGRDFLPEEDDPGQDGRVALLGNHFWKTHFASDPNVVGETISLNGDAHTVIGVLPHDGIWLDQAHLFVPMVRDPGESRGNNVLVMIGRLKPGVSEEAAFADMEAVAQRLAELYPDPNEGLGVNFAPATRWRADSDMRLALWVLMGAVGFLLLIACVNLANLLLARATGKQRETAVCAALGASRSRIVRRMIAESGLLAAIGAGLGLLLAMWATHLLKVYGANAVPRVDEVGVNVWVLGFTLAVTVATAMLSGLLPTLQAPFANLVSALREGDRGAAGSRGQNRIRDVLVGTEVALSLMLLVGAGLLVRSFGQLQRVDTGFDSENRLTFAVNLPETGNMEEESQNTRLFLADLLGRLQTAPQVRSAAAVNWKPLGASTINMAVRDIGRPSDGESTVLADWRYVTPGYFQTLGLSVVRGRDFTDQDRMHPIQAPPWNIIISQELADELWPSDDPLGRQVFLWDDEQATGTVVAVVENMRERGLDRNPTRAVYLPYNGATWSPVHFVVHTAGDPMALVPTIRSMLAEFDSSLPLYDIGNLDDSLMNSVAGRRLNALLLSAFSIVALVLALAGVYGVMAYSVAKRTSEIGVRVALGAGPGKVLRQIVTAGVRPAIIGIAVGLVGAFSLSRLLSNLLFEVEPTDPTTYLAVALLLGAASLCSCYLPARKALQVNPVEALREE